MLNTLKNRQGFTIIEVVIVLAIAGLIFAVVFIAVPQLQQGQRDSARDNEFNRFEAALTQFQSRNNGRLPDEGDSDEMDELVEEYMDGEFADPVGGDYGDPQGGFADLSFEEGDYYYATGQICDADDEPTSTNAGPRNYAIVYPVEQGPDVCRDNS